MATRSAFAHLPIAKGVLENPSPEELLQLTRSMPNAQRTAFGNYNVQTRVDARSAGSTYVVTDDPHKYEGQKVVSRAEAKRLADIQDAYIRDREMVLVSGTICAAGDLMAPACLYIERSNANVAGMQRTLYFNPGDSVGNARVLHDLHAQPPGAGLPQRPMHPGGPGGRRHPHHELGLLRRIEEGRPAHVEPQGLQRGRPCAPRRMQGHPRGRRRARLPHRRPVRHGQEPQPPSPTRTAPYRCRTTSSLLLPGGHVVATEDGCFAKTYRLNPKYEPVIYRAVTLPNLLPGERLAERRR